MNNTVDQETVQPENLDYLRQRYNLHLRGRGTTTVLMAHGLACSQSVWDSVCTHLESDYRLILFDFTGAGQADSADYNKARYGTLDGYVDDVLDICAVLELQDAVFIGHSVGGAIGLLASIQAPRFFARVVTVGASPRYLNDLPKYFGGFDQHNVLLMLESIGQDYANWAAGMATVATGENGSETVHRELLRLFLAAQPDRVENFARATFFCDLRPALKAVSCSVVVIQNDKDAIVPLEVAMYLHNALRTALRA